MSKKSAWQALFLGAALSLPVVAAHAAVTAEEAAQLGGAYTPVGAERKGNASGSIPEWTGGLTRAPDGVTGLVSGVHYPDPFGAEKPLAIVTRDNYEQHKDKLTEGQIALLKRGPNEKIAIYPSHRSCAYPRWLYDKTKKSATQATLANDGNTLVNSAGGFPFPFPKNGWEIMWNHKTNFYGATKFRAYSNGFTVNADGSFEETKNKEEVVFPHQMDDRTGFEGYNFLTKVTTLQPTRRKGNVLLIHDPLDQSAVGGGRDGWLYLTALRRTLRGPDVVHDAPDPDSQGLLTIDQRNMFSASLERYDWKIIGKTEKYIGYNAYPILNAADRGKVVQKSRLSADYMRYELHRVWVVEATLKKGQRHIYPRRVFYIDEDSWYIALADMYDAQGKLWKTAETQIANYYDRPACIPAVRVNYDLLDDRYYVELWSEKYEFDTNELTPDWFSPDSLRSGQR